MKKCLQCGALKPAEAFYRKADNTDGRFSICKPCHKARYRPHLLDAQRYYVYEHIRPDTGAVFYVGKGCDDRAGSYAGRKNVRWRRVVDKLKRNGAAHTAVLVYAGLTEEQAFSLEAQRIEFWRARGVDLCNFTDGGEGFRGLSRSETHCAKISATLKIRAAEIEKRTGHKMDPVHKEKLRMLNTGRKQSAEEVEQRRVANTGRRRTEAQRQNMREGNTPEVIARREATKKAIRDRVERAPTGAYKKCIRCEEIKDTSNFTRRVLSADGLHVYCRRCKNEMSRAQKLKRRVLLGIHTE